MPVIAIAAAVGASVVAGSAVAATVGGIMAISAVTAFEVVAAVGATIAAVGVVTRDKGLAMAGTVLGAIGGIGGLAAGAGLLGADAASNAPLFGAAPAASTADAVPGAAADAASANTVGTFSGTDASGLPLPPGAPPGGVGSVDAATGNVITAPAVGADAVSAGTPLAAQDAATLQAQQALVPAGTNNVGVAIGETPITAPTGATATPNPFGNLPPGAAGANAPGQPTLPTSTAVTPAEQASAALPAGVQGPVTTSSGLSSALDGILKFTKDNQMVAYGVLQAGGSLLSGATSTLTPAQVTALNAQAAANNAATALTQQQTTNLAMPKAVASSAPVTGAPATLVPQAGPGLINQPKAA